MRSLVSGLDPLVDPDRYREHRSDEDRAGCRISVVNSDVRWAFLAVAGTNHGAPRWLHVSESGPVTTDLATIAARLRSHLASSPTSTELDADSLEWLTAVVTRATRAEPELMPRRHQRALRQLATVTKRWADDAAAGGDEDAAGRWRT